MEKPDPTVEIAKITAGAQSRPTPAFNDMAVTSRFGAPCTYIPYVT